MRRWLSGIFRDPIVEILLKNSQLTKTQLETLLIDILAEKISGKRIVYEAKAQMRLIKPGVSRGSFNRTLAQARNNTIKSIYTLILLGYLGILDTPNIDPYIEIANRIRDYMEAYRNLWQKEKQSKEYLRVLQMLQQELRNELLNLSKQKSMARKS
ncbi:TPA: hypothetical protein EYP75_06670 [Candidatus Bathyarchaeota archaeon]|nr:hypothetical protein [Candidatus Bathyarchaeota archaeon]